MITLVGVNEYDLDIKRKINDILESINPEKCVLVFGEYEDG